MVPQGMHHESKRWDGFMENNRLFALDIGTRKIAGLVMEREADGYRVVASEMMEHNTRAMMDGQIHDVEAVAAVITRIKEVLEERLQVKLESAAVAAAGRSLKTARGEVERKRPFLDEITPEEVKILEIEAVQEAQQGLALEENKQPEKTHYICVGYSVVYYQLEGQAIQNLVGQIGSQVAVRVIATFLPRVVVDSLFSSLKRAGLDILSLTLEPIAAISVAIPPGLRLLNLALVDIGAGTADIAIVKNGNIMAYAMVPLGGDELTEALAGHYLMDFNTAESVKRLLANQTELEMVDILGNKFTASNEEVRKVLHPVINDITTSIAMNITELNQKVPDAIILVGGGSLTPDLPAALAEQMGLPPNRVGIRTPESMENIQYEADLFEGPQGVTPLGIAYHSFIVPPVPFVKVFFNGREMVLWNIGELTVANALISSGISLGQIYGRPGLGKTIEVNGVLKMFKGSAGTPPQIKVNGIPALLEDLLKDGDRVEFIPGKNGDDALVKVKDVVTANDADHYIVNGKKVQVAPLIKINGQGASIEDEVPDRGRVEYQETGIVETILASSGVPGHYLREHIYEYFWNEEKREIKWLPIKVNRGSIELGIKDILKPGSEITYTLLPFRPTIKDLLQIPDEVALRVFVNNREVAIQQNLPAIILDGRQAALHTELHHGARLTVAPRNGTTILSDIFKVVDIKPVPGGKLLMTVDGQEAGFTTPIFQDSRIDLQWIE